MNSCPINFGDCSDCEFYLAHNCEYTTIANLNGVALRRFLELAYDLSYINRVEKDLLYDLFDKVRI